jgi:flagellar FliJ protein
VKPFTLNAVLKHRKRLEDLAQNRLFEARKTHKTIHEKLNIEQRNLRDTISATEQMQSEGIEISRLIQFELKISMIQEDIGSIQKNLETKQKIVEQEHQNLLFRSKERQVMEKLKEKQTSNWLKYLNKKEAMMLDEIATIRHQTEK